MSRFVSMITAVLVMSSSAPAWALTRAATAGTGEFSLLYWRYLCRNQPQEEEVKERYRELRCPNQRWKVRTQVDEDQVIEVVEDVD